MENFLPVCQVTPKKRSRQRRAANEVARGGACHNIFIFLPQFKMFVTVDVVRVIRMVICVNLPLEIAGVCECSAPLHKRWYDSIVVLFLFTKVLTSCHLLVTHGRGFTLAFLLLNMKQESCCNFSSFCLFWPGIEP